MFLEVGARFKGLAGLAAMHRNHEVALLNLALEIAGRPATTASQRCSPGHFGRRRRAAPCKDAIISSAHEERRRWDSA